MQLNTTSRYAISVLLFLDKEKNSKLSTKELSKRLNIPYKYLTKIITKLSNANLINSSRGKFGGVMLSKELSNIKLIDIVLIFDDIDLSKCIVTNLECSYENVCGIHDKWQETKCSMEDFFNHTTLDDFIQTAKTFSLVK